MLKETLENLYSLISEGQLESDARRAMAIYREKSGPAFEDDPSYENRMALFTEWFMLDYPQMADSVSPIDFYIAGKGELAEEERRVLEALKANVHDIFWVKWSAEGKMKIWGMYTAKYFIVESSEKANLFRKGDMFETRIINLDDKWVPLNGFCHHPSGVYKFIKNEMKEIKKQDGKGLKSFIHKLAAMSLMSERARNIDVNAIYKTEAA